MSTQNSLLQMVPGPVSVDIRIRNAYLTEFGSSDVELASFNQLYYGVGKKIQQLVGTDQCDVVLMVGEGMLALWSALKSVVSNTPATKVLALGTGLYGYGIGDMAKQVGCQVQVIGLEFDQVWSEKQHAEIEEQLRAFQPDVVTAVHCETPSGTLNRGLTAIGQLIKRISPNTLFYVDFVSSAGGVPVQVDQACIDLGLLGSQKVLGCPPSLSIVTVSPLAWQRIESVNYVGYDALWPWKTLLDNGSIAPYTFCWNSLAALNVSLDLMLEEGLDNVYKRHETVARHFRVEARKLGLKIHAENDDAASPTVTTCTPHTKSDVSHSSALVFLPNELTFAEFDAQMRAQGIVLANSFGKLENKVARVGHMGRQATMDNVNKVLKAIEKILKK